MGVKRQDKVFNNLKNIENKVLEAIASVREFILSDGGDIEFVKIENGKVYVRLMGACKSCPLIFFTLTHGIEEAIKERVPDIQGVELID